MEKNKKYSYNDMHIRRDLDTGKYYITIKKDPIIGKTIKETVVETGEVIRYTAEGFSLGVVRNYENPKYKRWPFYSKESVMERLFGEEINPRSEIKIFSEEDLLNLQNDINEFSKNIYDGVFVVENPGEKGYEKLDLKKGQVLVRKMIKITDDKVPLSISLPMITSLKENFSILVFDNGRSRVEYVNDGRHKTHSSFYTKAPDDVFKGYSDDVPYRDFSGEYFTKGKHYRDARCFEGFSIKALSRKLEKEKAQDDVSK